MRIDIITVLPELLRSFADYRMLIYAIVLILMMLITNNPTLRNMLLKVKGVFAKGGQANE